MPITNSTFLTQVLSTPNFHIPLEANFIIGIENLDTIITNLDAAKDIISDSALQVYPDVWNGDQNLDVSDVYFANGVKVPGEGSSADRVGLNTNTTLAGGLISGPILKGRKNLANFEISFLETNTSFIDYVIRPWIVAVSQFGLFSRKSSANLNTQVGIKSTQDFKTDITIAFLDKTNSDVIRKLITFHNAAPIDVASYDATYGKVGMRTAAVTWTYSTYEVGTNSAVSAGGSTIPSIVVPNIPSTVAAPAKTTTNANNGFTGGGGSFGGGGAGGSW